MNYFAHGRHALVDPYRLAGVALPDWLNVVNRRSRLRARRIEPLLGDGDERVAAIARGVLEHLQDDAWFHETRAFAELSLEFCCQLRDELRDLEGFRPHFLGHILVELLLDAELIAAAPQRLDAYYAALSTVDGELIESVVARVAAQPADGLAYWIPLFCRERFLSDYADDAKLLRRLNQVLRRVGLALLPDRLCDWLPIARDRVAARAGELMQKPLGAVALVGAVGQTPD